MKSINQLLTTPVSIKSIDYINNPWSKNIDNSNNKSLDINRDIIEQINENFWEVMD